MDRPRVPMRRLRLSGVARLDKSAVGGNAAAPVPAEGRAIFQRS